jgi:hypothetical protein
MQTTGHDANDRTLYSFDSAYFSDGPSFFVQLVEFRGLLRQGFSRMLNRRKTRMTTRNLLIVSAFLNPY